MPENHLAWELYYRIIQLSRLQEISWQKGKKSMKGYFPTLEKIDFVLEKFVSNDISIDELDFLIEKISLIHNLKLNYSLG